MSKLITKSPWAKLAANVTIVLAVTVVASVSWRQHVFASIPAPMHGTAGRRCAFLKLNQVLIQMGKRVAANFGGPAPQSIELGQFGHHLAAAFDKSAAQAFQRFLQLCIAEGGARIGGEVFGG